MQSGWICLHRDLLNWEWWGDTTTLKVWMWILLRANHEKKRWRGVEIEAGSFITSQQNGAEEARVSTQQLRTSLLKLSSTGEIVVKSTNRFTLIQVQNWSKFQSVNKQITNKQQTNNKQITTNNNDKQLNNLTTTGGVEKKLLKWLSGMEDVTNPTGLTEFYLKKYPLSNVKRALNDAACISRNKFIEICEFLGNEI